MLERLPELIDPISLAEKRRVLSGQISLSKLTRLTDSLADNTSALEVTLSFAKEGSLATVQGHIQGNLRLCCQSCLEPIDFPVDFQIKLAVVHSLEQAERLAGEYEPLMLDEEKIPLSNLVEDELLLIVPDFPRHSYDCIDYNSLQKADNPSKQSESLSTNPFSVLAKLKNTGD